MTAIKSTKSNGQKKLGPGAERENPLPLTPIRIGEWLSLGKSRNMISYWEKQSLIHYDYLVVGAGFMGWNMAIEIKEARPRARVLVLDQSRFFGSASLRNAGFACMGSLTELIDDMLHMPEAEMIDLFRRRREGLRISRQRYGDQAIGYAEKGSYEILFEEEEAYLQAMENMNQRLWPLIGEPAFAPASGKIADFGFGTHKVKALIENRLEGELNSGKLWLACQRYAQGCGVEYRSGARVREWNETPRGVDLVLEPLPWAEEEPLRLTGDKLFLCTNAHAPELLDGLDMEPGRGQVLITRPIKGLRIQGCFHFDSGYYYFRELEGRLLFGGGRNLDFEGERCRDHGLHPKIQSRLESHIRDWILPNTPFEVELRWSGIMGFGPRKIPLVFGVSDRVWAACRLGGMGVALAPQLARELWALSQGKGESQVPKADPKGTDG